MRGSSITYNKEFFESEIQRDTNLLNQGISNEQRVFVQNRLAAARQYLADYEKAETVSITAR